MAANKVARRARASLDARFKRLGPTDAWQPPPSGWIRAVRDALGMSARELGARLDVTSQAVTALEHAERRGGIRLSSLRRAANAMDCDVVYALVPRSSLDHTVRHAAENAARRRLGRVAGTMALEDQAVDEVDDDQLRLEADLLIEAGQVWAPLP